MSSFQGTSRSDNNSTEDPIREELFSVERLEQYAAESAAEHSVSANPGRGRRLLPRLEENGRKLIAVYRALAEAIRNERTGKTENYVGQGACCAQTLSGSPAREH